MCENIDKKLQEIYDTYNITQRELDLVRRENVSWVDPLYVPGTEESAFEYIMSVRAHIVMQVVSLLTNVDRTSKRGKTWFTQNQRAYEQQG